MHCKKRLSDAGPFDLIQFEDAKREEVERYLHGDRASSYLPALGKAAEVIDGFESPLGMELLATVDWLLVQEKCEPTVAGLRAGTCRAIFWRRLRRLVFMASGRDE